MSRLLVVQHEAVTGPGWWGRWLGESGLELDVVRADERAVPGLEGYAGLLVLGGAMAPQDDVACPWLPAVRERLADAVRRGLPTFGICLGAELLAVACGGAVRRGVAGPELGVCDVELAPAAVDDPVLGVLPDTSRVLQWHWEEMHELPPGSVLLAGSARYPHQAFRVGSSAWGVQGHPEVTPAIAAAWGREDSPLLQAAGRSAGELVAELDTATDELVRTWRPVAQAFAALVARRA